MTSKTQHVDGSRRDTRFEAKTCRWIRLSKTYRQISSSTHLKIFQTQHESGTLPTFSFFNYQDQGVSKLAFIGLSMCITKEIKHIVQMDLFKKVFDIVQVDSIKHKFENISKHSKSQEPFRHVHSSIIRTKVFLKQLLSFIDVH